MTAPRHSKTSGGRARPVGISLIQCVAAAVLSAAVSFSITGPAQSQSERFPAGPADMFKPGSVFRYYAGTTDPARIEGLNAAINMMTAQSEEVAATIATVRNGIETGTADSSHDELARSVAAGIEGTFSIVVQAGFLRALSSTNPAFGRMLETSRMTIHLPDGETVEMPVLLAAAVHSLSVVAAGEKLRSDTQRHELTGTYDLETTGACDVPEGAVELTQEDFVIEGISGERLILFGAVGDARIYLVSNEQRFASMGENPDGSHKIDVPDRPSDLFEAITPKAGDAVTFRSITRGTCSFTLTQPG